MFSQISLVLDWFSHNKFYKAISKKPETRENIFDVLTAAKEITWQASLESQTFRSEVQDVNHLATHAPT